MESTYEECLFYELMKQNLKVEKQKALSIRYEDLNIESAFRIDLIIENKVIIELNTTENIQNIHKAQLLTYLKLSNCKLGLLINFNVELLKHGVLRIINGNL